jgi:hypothetical protein
VSGNGHRGAFVSRPLATHPDRARWPGAPRWAPADAVAERPPGRALGSRVEVGLGGRAGWRLARTAVRVLGLGGAESGD